MTSSHGLVSKASCHSANVARLRFHCRCWNSPSARRVCFRKIYRPIRVRAASFKQITYMCVYPGVVFQTFVYDVGHVCCHHSNSYTMPFRFVRDVLAFCRRLLSLTRWFFLLVAQESCPCHTRRLLNELAERFEH